MGTHLWRFLGAAWKLLRNSLSTSNLSIIIFSVCAPIALFLALVVLEWSKGSRTSSSFVAALGESTKTALLTAGITIFLWLSLFSWAVYKSVYNDHQNLAGRLRAVVNEKDELKQGLETRDNTIRYLSGKVATQSKGCTSNKQGCPALAAQSQLPVEKRCWQANHFEEPNLHIKGAVTATTVILHCNYRIEAPFQVAVEFEKDNFFNGGTYLPNGSVVSIGGASKQGKVFIGEVESPSVPANDLIVVTVEGSTDQFPKTVRAEVASR